MTMDISYWNNLSSKIRHEETTKQFFGKFLWRMVIDAPQARVLLYKHPSLEEAIEHRQSINRGYIAWTGNWRKIANNDVADVELLRTLQGIKAKYAAVIRTRIEEPSMQIYSHDEATLKLIAEEFGLEHRDNIVSISGPTNSDVEEILLSGAILRRKETEYNHKVILRDGRYTREVKQQILHYLDGLGDVVKLSSGSRTMLNKQYPSMWNVFFYTKDPKVTTFLSLIEPRIVSNIHPLVNLKE